jgi:hypothetical protein
MSDKQTLDETHDQHPCYEIRLKGHLYDRWSDWFGGFTITLEDSGDTLLTGTLVDQAALHGLLKRIRDLGMTLISVNAVEPWPPTSRQTDQSDAPDINA